VNFGADGGRDDACVSNVHQPGAEFRGHRERFGARIHDEIRPMPGDFVHVGQFAATYCVFVLDLLGLRRGKPLALVVVLVRI
jgi:hypothetical protein